MDDKDIVSPPKTYTVKKWEVRLKSGAAVECNIREDKGHSYHVIQQPNGERWSVWQWPDHRRETQIRENDISALDYSEVELKEIPAFVPKHKKHAKAETRHEA